MAHPLNWPKKSFFYPLGSTTPVVLTQDLSPELDANVLLLACGDPRSILYTLHADLSPEYRQMDFTCSDPEPAVLARNILLFTMIDDGVPIRNIWYIFHHFFLDQESYALLLAQCRNLLQASSDLDVWKKSTYGRYIGFCAKQSLEEIRHHWNLFLETDNLPAQEKDDLKLSFLSGMKSVRDKYSSSGSLRATGPLLSSFISESVQTHHRFWTTGLTPSHSTQIVSHPYVNPTFAYYQGKREFNVHYGTDPLQCFFLAPCLAKLDHSESTRPPTLEDFGDSVMAQFSTWCSTFRTRLSSGSSARLVVRFFVGEALAFSQALHICRIHRLTKTGIYMRSWGGSQIEFDEECYELSSNHQAPLMFNVIDTSNLADHAGLVNLLVATVPLLDVKPWSTLHTNTLLRYDQYGSPATGPAGKAFADIPTLCILLGVAPAPYLSHFVTHSNKHESIMSSFASGQLLDPISWKIPSSPIPSSSAQNSGVPPSLVCNAEDLGRFLFSVYLQMFSEENMHNNLQNINQATLQKQVTPHYIRASLAIFFGFVRARVETNWPLVTLAFFKLLEQDRTLETGFNNYQDLLCELYIRDLHSCYYLSPGHLQSQLGRHTRFQGWRDLPSVVCIVLKVPRAYLKRLEDMDLDGISPPILYCASTGPQGHSLFSSFRPVFGDTIVSRDASGETTVDVVEDRGGWNSNAPLIVTFYMPTWIILKNDPKTFSIGLHIRPDPQSINRLRPKFGAEFIIYATKLSDMQHIQIVRRRPGNDGEIARFRKHCALVKSQVDIGGTLRVKLGFAGTKVAKLTICQSIDDPAAVKAFEGGASVSSVAASDTTMLVTFDKHRCLFVYPFPICGKQTICRVARKSLYVEIEAAVRPSYEDSRDFSLNPFPLIAHYGDVQLLNLHYVNLSVLPSLQVTASKAKLQWIPSHLELAFSRKERQALSLPAPPDRGTLVNVKDTINSFFMNYFDLANQPKRCCLFGLTDLTDDELYALVYVNKAKLDVQSHTVVLDACVVPLDDRALEKLLPPFSDMVKILTAKDETQAWKSLLPALAERCRTWQHSLTCEYRSRRIPVTFQRGHSPLCSCGKGKDLGLFGELMKWKDFHEDATRIALSPLFTTSFEVVGTDMLGSNTSNASSSPACQNCGGPGEPQLLICTRCKRTRYCSRSCQKQHWKDHKLLCQRSQEVK